MIWTTHLAPCIWKIALTVNNYLLVYKPLLEVYYWIQKQKRKKNMKNTFYWQFFTFTILMLYFFSFGCWPCKYLMQIPILYGRFCLYLTDCHMLLQTSTSDKIKKISELFKELFNKTRQTFHGYFEMFSSSQTIFLVLNMFYYLPMNSHSITEGKRPKGHLKFTFIYESITGGIRIQVYMRPLSCWMNCCPGTNYFSWVENKPLKEWYWNHLFLLGSAAKSMHFHWKIYQNCQGV